MRCPLSLYSGGAEELGKLAQWPCASLLHGREEQVCTSLSCTEHGPGSLYPGEGCGGTDMPVFTTDNISATLRKGGIMQFCMSGVCMSPTVGYSRPFHGRWDGDDLFIFYMGRNQQCTNIKGTRSTGSLHGWGTTTQLQIQWLGPYTW